MLVGDDVKKVAEAATFAKKLIGCTILENTPYYRSSGHVQVRTRWPPAHIIEQHPAGFTTLLHKTSRPICMLCCRCGFKGSLRT